MLYFSLSLLLSILLSSALLAVLIMSLKINWSRKNRRPLSFLTPILLTILFIVMTMYVMVPRVLDAVSMVNKSYNIEVIRVSDDDIGWSTLQNDRRTFYFNQWRYDFQTGKTYQISYTPNSRFIVFADEVTDASEN